MAVVHNNTLTRGLSGKVGEDMLFKQINDKTFVYKKPRKPSRQSPQQKENRSKFRRATAYAKTMMADPVKKAEYWEKAKKLNLPNAYTAAITEYMRTTEISEVKLERDIRKGREQTTLTAKKKDFDVEVVEVVLVGAEGEILEEGKAVKGLGYKWIYPLKETVPSQEVKQLLICVRERTGRLVEKKLRF